MKGIEKGINIAENIKKLFTRRSFGPAYAGAPFYSDYEYPKLGPKIGYVPVIVLE